MKIILLSLMVLISLANSRGVKVTKLCNQEIKKEKPKKWRLEQYCVQAGEHYQGKYGKRNYPLATHYYLMGGKNDKNINEIQPYTAKSASFRNIGHSYVVTGDFKEAENLYRKFLKNVCIVFADEEIQSDYKTLANIYPRKKENLKKGLALWNKIYTQILVAAQLSKEGMAFYQNGDYSSAIESFQKSLAIEEEILGRRHNNIVERNNYLGMAYGAMGNHSKALEYKQKALKIRQQILTQEYSLVALVKGLDLLSRRQNLRQKSDTKMGDSVASSYSYLQNIYRDMGMYPEALESYQKASVIQKKILGEAYSPLAGNYNNLGLLYRDMGKYLQALESHQKALNIDEKFFGKESIQTAKSNNYLGTLYRLMKNYPKSLEYYQKALASRINFLGDQNTETAKSYSDLADLYYAMKNYLKSLEYYKKALVINENLLGETHIKTAKNYNDLSILYRRIEDYTKSQEYYEKALFSINTQQEPIAKKICDVEVKKDHTKRKRVQIYCTKAGEYYQNIKNNDSASWYYLLGGKYNKNINEMQATIKKGATYRIIGHCYVMKGEFKKAKELYSKFLKNASILVLNDEMQTDFKLLTKLYPNKKKNIRKGLSLWNKMYKPLKKVESLYAQYRSENRGSHTPQARKTLFQIIELQKKYQNENNIFIFDNIYLMGKLYTNIFIYRKKDLDLFHQVEKVYQTYSDRTEELGRLYSDIGRSYEYLRQIDKSIDYYKKAINIKEKIIEKDSVTANWSSLNWDYNNLSQLYEKRRKYASALKYAKKALALKEKLSELSSSDDTETYTRLGSLYLKVGDYPKALMYYQKVLAIKEILLEKKYGYSRSKQRDIAFLYDSIASLYLKLYDYSKALEYQKKVLDINRKWHRGDRDEDIFPPSGGYNLFGVQKTASTYNNIAVVYSAMGNDSKALEYYLKSFNIYDKVKVKIGSTIYLNIGSAYQGKKDYNKAMDFYQKALAALDNTHIRPLDTEASLYSHLGSLYKKMKDYPKALKYYQKSLAITKKIFGNEHPSIGSSYSNIGWLYLTMKNYPEAYSYAKLSFEVFLKNRDKVFTILDSKQKTQYLKETTGYISLFLRSSYGYTYRLKKANQTKEAQQILHSGAIAWLNYKGSIFDSENAIAMLYSSTKDKKLKAKIDDLVNSKRYLAKLYQTLPKSKEKKSWQKNIKTAEEKISKLTNDISSKASIFKEQQGLKSITYKDITSHLKKNELYIDYAKVGGYYYLFSLDSKENIAFVQIDKTSTKKIDKLVKSFREDINTIVKSKNLSDEKLKILTQSSKEKLSQLYELVIKKPLGETIKDKTSLIISPDGALLLLPFEALFDKKDNKTRDFNFLLLSFEALFDKEKGKYFIEEKEIRYIPSGKELVRLYKYSKDKVNKKERAVIFANPNFNTKLASLTRESIAITPNTNRSGIIEPLFRMEFTPLPGTKAEAKAIKATFPKGSITEYLQEEATEANLIKVKEPNILHIATHGFFINDNTIPNPMLKSGIALTGANISRKLGKSNGIVTALKLSGLDLKGTDLVVLSACETGVVDTNSTDSVSGLSKAFIQAGAKDIVMSLWSVDDQATKELMTSFYQEMKQNKNYAKALKAAKLKMITENRHPFYWGSFVVSGL